MTKEVEGARGRRGGGEGEGEGGGGGGGAGRRGGAGGKRDKKKKKKKKKKKEKRKKKKRMGRIRVTAPSCFQRPTQMHLLYSALLCSAITPPPLYTRQRAGEMQAQCPRVLGWCLLLVWHGHFGKQEAQQL